MKKTDLLGLTVFALVISVGTTTGGLTMQVAEAKVNVKNCGPNDDADVCLAGGSGRQGGGGGGRTTVEAVEGGADDVTQQGGGGGNSDGNVGGGGGNFEFESGTCDFKGGEGRHLQGDGDAGSEDNSRCP